MGLQIQSMLDNSSTIYLTLPCDQLRSSAVGTGGQSGQSAPGLAGHDFLKRPVTQLPPDIKSPRCSDPCRTHGYQITARYSTGSSWHNSRSDLCKKYNRGSLPKSKTRN